MTASQWREWARKRKADAEIVRRTYLRQAQQAEQIANNHWCACDPLVQFGTGAEGPVFTNPMITHQLWCTADRL
jgi:hypothetical protein